MDVSESSLRRSETLPFVVRIASESDLPATAQLRSASYGKHLPDLREKLLSPEPSDFERGCAVVVAACKSTGALLGTLRIHTNLEKVLPLQLSMDLPASFRKKRMMEATRLCVLSHPHARQVRSSLFKALFQFCNAQKMDWMLATGRRPIDRIYDSLQFVDVEEPGKFYAMANVNGMLHRVMGLKATTEENWAKSKHPLFDFVYRTDHADIDLSAAQDLSAPWEGAG